MSSFMLVYFRFYSINYFSPTIYYYYRNFCDSITVKTRGRCFSKGIIYVILSEDIFSKFLKLIKMFHV